MEEEEEEVIPRAQVAAFTAASVTLELTQGSRRWHTEGGGALLNQTVCRVGTRHWASYGQGTTSAPLRVVLRPAELEEMIKQL